MALRQTGGRLVTHARYYWLLLDEALLEGWSATRCRSVCRQHESPPQIPEIVGEHAQLQPDFV